MAEHEESKRIPRVWVISEVTWVEPLDSRDYTQETLDPDLGFFLLEADALARVDQLNKGARERYVLECQETLVKHRAAVAKREEALRRNEVLVANGFEELPVPKEAQAPVQPPFEEWLTLKHWPYFEAVELQPGKTDA